MADTSDIDDMLSTLATASCAEKCRAIALLRGRVSLPRDADVFGRAMSQALSDEAPLVRAEAAEALGEPELVSWHADLIQTLEWDEDATVRASAAEALGEARNVAAVPALVRALQDPDGAVRGYAAGSLGLLGILSSLSAVSAQLSKEHTASRFDMMAAMVRLANTPEAVGALIGALTRVEDSDAFRALNALQDLLERNTPSELLLRLPELQSTLNSAAERLDFIHHGHIQQLVGKTVELIAPDDANGLQSGIGRDGKA